MNRHPASRASLVAAILVGVGAILSAGLLHLLILQGVDARRLPVQDPIGWAFGPRPQPLGLAAMLLGLIVLVGLTWLVVRAVVRGALPTRMAAAFFGTWGAVVVASLAAGAARTPLAVAALQIPQQYADVIGQQVTYLVTSNVLWAVFWGWIPALAVTVIHRAAARRAPTGAPQISAADPLRSAPR